MTASMHYIHHYFVECLRGCRAPLLFL